MSETIIAGDEPLESYVTRLNEAVDEVRTYLGQGDYSPHSGHEGYAIILKHVDNLWTVVKDGGGHSPYARKICTVIIAAVACYMVHVSKDHWVDTRAILGNTRDARVDMVLSDISAELLKARKKFPPFSTADEGFAVFLEEFEELWDEIKGNNDRTEAAYAEAKQTGAMALSFMLDIARSKR